MKTRFSVYLWGGSILLAGCLASLTVQMIIPPITRILVALTILWFVGCAIFEIYMRVKESKYIKINRSVDPRKITVLNDGYDVAEGCVVKINKLYVLGRNKTCQKIADGNWGYIFQWEDEFAKPNITFGEKRNLNIFDVTNDGIFLLFQDIAPLFLPLYKDIKNGETAKKGKYQIEVVLFGNGKTNGGSDLIKKKSYWEIHYQSNGKDVPPSFKMEQIKKMNEVTGRIDEEPYSARVVCN